MLKFEEIAEIAKEFGVMNTFDFQQALLRVYNRAWTEGYHHGGKQLNAMWMNAIDHQNKSPTPTAAPTPKRAM